MEWSDVSLLSGLFVFSFLAATIIPVSSEAALTAALWGGYPSGLVLLIASFGNCLGILLNYWIGAGLASRRKQPSKLELRTHHWVEHYGWSALLLSWLPVIGDPITIAAGWFRMNFWLFAVLGCGLRVARYGVVVYWIGG